MTGRLFEIREFTLHDGPGVRTTVFLKGCPLRCAWCHNPEGQSREKETMRRKDGTAAVCGEDWTADALAAELLRNADIFAQSGGGVTFSGGEPLAQAAFVAEVADRLRAAGVPCALETSGHAPEADYRAVVSRMDFVYQDLKHHDAEAFRRWCGGDLELVLRNLEWLRGSGVPFAVRVPCVPGVNDTPADREAFLRLVGSGTAVEFLPYNPAAPAKYPMLDRTFPLGPPPREFPLVLAHRGGLGDYDDNAVGGFADALARGILGAETDVRLTKDGELVIMHDPTVDRTTDGTGRVDEMTLAEATALRLKRSGENVPTLRQFCEVYRGRPDVDIEIELKEHGDEIAPERLDRYVRLVHDQAAEALVPGAYAFTSFCVPTLERFRELYPDARLGLICETLTEDRVAEAVRLGCVRVASRWDLSPQNLVDKLHAAGLSVNLWCGDSPEIYDAVKAMGADVTTSNVPRAVIEYARANPRP